MLYMFVLSLYFTDGTYSTNIAEMGLTSNQCIAMLESYNAENPNWDKGTPSCELQVEFPADPD